jgi:AcrR family transcriptional regulator
MAELTKRQKDISEAAIKVIAEGGIQKLTMGNVARQLDISEPAIYRHFSGKLDILLAMLGQFKQRAEFQLKQVQFFDTSGLLLLETIFLEHSAQFTANPHLAAVMFSEEAFCNDPRLREEIVAILNLTHETISGVIERAQSKGQIRADLPSDHLALMTLGALRLLVKRWHLSNFAFDLREESSRVWESLKTLLLARP